MPATLAAGTAVSGISAGDIFGSLGAGGAALALTAALVLGIRGKGKHKLNHESAGFLGFVAGTLYVVAGQVWQFAGGLTNSLAATLTGPAGPLGNVGQGAIALTIVAWFWLGKPRPGKGALQGIAAATVFGTAGGIWGLFPALVLQLLSRIGVH